MSHDERFSRVVGRRRSVPIGEVPPREVRDAWDALVRGRRTCAPKGVFRYATAEQAEADRQRWTLEAMVKAQASQGE